MIYFASDLFFGDKDVAHKRHYASSEEMDSDIISKWNRTVCSDDDVYILGNIGELEFLKGLNGSKTILMADSERAKMLEYVETVSKTRDKEYDEEIYSFHMKSEYDIRHLSFSGSFLRKIYSGRIIKLGTSYDPYSPFGVYGSLSEYQRVFKSGINANIYLNGMYPTSEVDLEDLAKHVGCLL